ncbi:MAG: hypothetical protein AB8H47_29170, partial [Bacteroidia bacterium]
MSNGFGQPISILIDENFSSASGNTPPSGWSNIIINGVSTDVWRFDNSGARSMNTPMTAPFAIFDSDAYSNGGGLEEVSLESPVFNASSLGVLNLAFDYYFLGGYGGEMYVDVYNGSTWTNVLSRSEEHT